MEEYDIIIIGAGPGGLTAGIYAGRQGTRNLIIDRDLAGGIGREVPEMENYPGFDNISGLELIEKMKSQATKGSQSKPTKVNMPQKALFLQQAVPTDIWM